MSQSEVIRLESIVAHKTQEVPALQYRIRKYKIFSPRARALLFVRLRRMALRISSSQAHKCRFINQIREPWAQHRDVCPHQHGAFVKWQNCSNGAPPSH